MSFVYPSLPPEAAGTRLLHVSAVTSAEQLRSEATRLDPRATYYATGLRVPEARIATLAEKIRCLVDDLGFPKPRQAQAAATSFDHALPQILVDEMQIVPANAAQEGVWSFLSLVVLPDVAVWRYPARARERLLGLPRNVFRRLWWRGYILGTDSTAAPAVFGEDQLVAVMERPTIAGNRRLARALCSAVLGAEAAGPTSGMFLMREAAKRLIRLTPFLCPDALSDQEIEDVGREVVSAARSSISASGTH
jgi:hypothetical protein